MKALMLLLLLSLLIGVGARRVVAGEQPGAAGHIEATLWPGPAVALHAVRLQQGRGLAAEVGGLRDGGGAPGGLLFPSAWSRRQQGEREER